MIPKVIAHRGASAYAPENTMPAFELAYNMGARGLELDVHLTKDGRVVVIHDDTVNRTSNGSGSVNELTYEELLSLDFSKGREDFNNVRIPLLEDVYEFASQTNMFVNVEVKENAFTNEFVIVDKLFELEKKFNMSQNISYSSFNHYILREMKKKSGETSTGILYFCGLVDVWDYASRINADAIHPYYGCLMDADVISGCHERGIAVRPWTVDSEELMSSLIRAGVDSIITNKPDVALVL